MVEVPAATETDGSVDIKNAEVLDRIAAFARKHHVMTVATVGSDGGPWCAHVFYAWMAGAKGADGADGGPRFVFTSDETTRHGAEMAACPRVAAAIALETRIVGRVQGLQIEGAVRRPVGPELAAARRAYLRRFPYAAVVDLSLWILEPQQMKFTDNTLGFGKKLIFRKA